MQELHRVHRVLAARYDVPLVDAVLGCAPVFERQFRAAECDANSTYYSAIAPEVSSDRASCEGWAPLPSPRLRVTAERCSAVAPEDDPSGARRAAARAFVADAGVDASLRYALEMIWQVTAHRNPIAPDPLFRGPGALGRRALDLLYIDRHQHETDGVGISDAATLPC